MSSSNDLTGTPFASDPASELRLRSDGFGLSFLSEDFARRMDEDDPLKEFRKLFCIPQIKDLPGAINDAAVAEKDCVYFCGNSLGPKPKAADEDMAKCLDDWAKWGVLTHVIGDLPAASCDLPGISTTATLIGAKPNEVAIMNALTVNLNLLLVSFYKPTVQRHKIIMEANAFPSDRYAIKSHISFHGYDPKADLIQMAPRQGEHYLRTNDIIQKISDEGDSIAVIMFSGVQYYTGQKFDMKKITEAGHAKGCIVGFDLAHAIGNVKLEMNKWEVDFACWCTYKYLNSGSGGIGGAFIHEKHNSCQLKQLQGWWGNVAETRFEMKEEPDLDVGVAGLRLSNPPPWLACLNLASLKIFEQTSMDQLIAKQFLLTGYLELLLDHYFDGCKSGTVIIITPRDPNQRGCQLSLLFSQSVEKIHAELQKRGVLCDIRRPNVIRVAPIPLYNSFHDVYRFVHLLISSLKDFY